MRERHCARAATLPGAQHGKLAVDLLKSSRQCSAYLAVLHILDVRSKTTELSQYHLMKLRFTILNLLPATMAVVHSKEAPVVLSASTMQERVHKLVPILHVGPEILIRILREAD